MTINRDIIEIDLTLRCNLKCPNCDRMAPKAVDIKLEDLKKFVSLNRTWKRINLLGGEPTLYPYFEEALKILEPYKDRCEVGIKTNGYNPELLNKIPSWIDIENSGKKSSDQNFVTFNVAPIDEGITTGFEKGCHVPQRCGMNLSVDGLYYPCSAGATVAREFNINVGKADPEDVNEEMFRILCQYCGHFKTKNWGDPYHRSTKQLYSKTWREKLNIPNTNPDPIKKGGKVDYLQIHDVRPVSQVEQFCMARVQALMGKDDTYTLIQIPYYENIVETVNASDRVRFDWLALHPDGCYIDTDCYINLPVNLSTIENGLPLFPQFQGKHLDIFWIYVNGNCKYFRDNFKPKVREDYLKKFVKEKDRHLFYGWPVELTKKLPEVNIIPPQAYNHTTNTMAKEIRRRLENNGNNR